MSNMAGEITVSISSKRQCTCSLSLVSQELSFIMGDTGDEQTSQSHDTQQPQPNGHALPQQTLRVCSYNTG